jgi:16S rRNA processing protein RimM
MAGTESRHVCVGRIAGVYGVKGWVRVKSFTDPPENIFKYKPWRLQGKSEVQTLTVAEGRCHGKGTVARLETVGDRDAAAALSGMDIFVERAQLPEADNGQYYWTDLEGLEVVTTDGTLLGNVNSVIATGANDVLVVCGNSRRLIPFIVGDTVQSVDFETGTITVAWDPAF